MTPSFALWILGGALIVAGVTNRNLIDVLLGRDTENPGGRAPSAGGGGFGGSLGKAAAVLGGLLGKPMEGKIIGTPHAGTHTLGNWQSDNAVDIAGPRGTPVYAVADGSITKVSIAPEGGRISGSSITLTTGGNAYFYTHLSRVTVKSGQKVSKGQKIGESGVANGVGHLHFGQQHGNPQEFYR